jgi:hypothetical protein
MEAVCFNTGDELSETVAVKLKEPASNGVPVKAPAGLSVSPLGNAPEAVHVYGAVPPVTEKF